jgi:multidrug efflux pump subunit AcrB
VKNITVFYGMGSPRFQTTYAPQIGGTNFAQFIINTGGDKDTQGLLNDYAELYSDYFPNARVRFKELSYSDARYPVEVRIQGNNPDSIHIATDSVMRRLRQDPQVYLVHSSFEGNREALNVVMDRDESNRLGISKSLLSLNLATRFGPGFKISSVWEGDYPMNVVLKDVNAGTQDVTNLENAMVGGVLPMTNVPLRQMSDVKPEWNDGAIYRRSGLRCASVFAETARGHNMARVNNSIFEELKTLRLPEGISILAGGQKESDLRYGKQVYGGLSLSVVVIFFILLFHLKKLKLTFLMMYSLLYSLLGASLGLTLGGHELGLTGLLGLISLMGIIARNGIIMVDYAEELRTVGEGNGPMSAEQAILLASKRRMRPIFLTSAAASMGVVPMVIENSPMWGPMGVGIFFGTIFSMVFILTMIPVGYSLIMKNEDNNNQA